jgi:ubiquinone/menaquinone biosynthesis C-methylase UbiE
VEHWTEYWQNTSSVNSFGEGEFKDGYDGELASVWKVIIDVWQPSAKVLDLGTGNGGLALLALSIRPDLDIHACDAANINPSQILNTKLKQFKNLEKIQFVGNQKIEDLAFEASSFEHVISQFGLEYAEFDASLKQVYRVLRAGGSSHFMIHHNESFVTHNSVLGLKVLGQFLKPQGVMDLLKGFIQFCRQTLDIVQDKSTLQAFNSRNNELLGAFKSIQRDLALDEEIEWFNDISSSLIELVQNWRSTRFEKVIEVEQSLLFFRERLNEQVNVAQNDLQMREKLKYCESRRINGLDV